MSYHTDDTICAIATAAGGAARGMVRVSGRDAVAVVSRVFEPAADASLTDVRSPRAIEGQVRVELENLLASTPHAVTPAGQCGQMRRMPCSLFLWPSVRSYTREPVAELHTIGSDPLLQSLVTMVCRHGARLAEPGEFTLRAFLAGRLDLTQAEGVLGVIDARGDNDLRGALAQLAGGIARPLGQLRETLLQLLAELEAGLDFVDEDIEFISSADAQHRLQLARQTLDEVAQQMATRHTVGQAVQIALTGAPNAGKSSLFNALVARLGRPEGRDRAPHTPALVSPQPGTTRDYLTAILDLDGLQCELIDTAGVDTSLMDRAKDSPMLRPPPTADIDREAQLVAAERGARAAIRVCCVDPTPPSALDSLDLAGGDVVVLTKADIAPRPPRAAFNLIDGRRVVATSSRTGEGLDALSSALREMLTADAAAQPGQVVTATAERCRESIRQGRAALQRAADVLAAAGGDELVAAELRSALSELGKVVGAVYTDDVLDRIFSSFCIGK